MEITMNMMQFDNLSDFERVTLRVFLLNALKALEVKPFVEEPHECYLDYAGEVCGRYSFTCIGCDSGKVEVISRDELSAMFNVMRHLTLERLERATNNARTGTSYAHDDIAAFRAATRAYGRSLPL